MTEKTQKGVHRETLTTRQGHPVTDNQNIRTVGNRGPATLENYHFIEKFPILTRKKSRSEWSMLVGRGHSDILKHMGRSGTSL